MNYAAINEGKVDFSRLVESKLLKFLTVNLDKLDGIKNEIHIFTFQLKNSPLLKYVYVNLREPYIEENIDLILQCDRCSPSA